jgi:GDP-L-fucose synthase
VNTPKNLACFCTDDDMAAPSLFVMEFDKATYDLQTEPMQSNIIVGFGLDITIKELAEMISKVIAY